MKSSEEVFNLINNLKKQTKMRYHVYTMKLTKIKDFSPPILKLVGV